MVVDLSTDDATKEFTATSAHMFYPLGEQKNQVYETIPFLKTTFKSALSAFNNHNCVRVQADDVMPFVYK